MGAWRGPFLATVAVVILVEVSMVALDMGPEPVLVAAVLALAGATTWCVRSLALTTHAVEPPTLAVAEPMAPSADRRVRSLRSSIVFGASPRSGRDADAEQLRTTLVGLVDDELWESHGIDRLAQPEAAASLLHPELDRFVSDPDSADAMTDPKQIERIVTLIERL